MVSKERTGHRSNVSWGPRIPLQPPSMTKSVLTCVRSEAHLRSRDMWDIPLEHMMGHRTTQTAARRPKRRPKSTDLSGRRPCRDLTYPYHRHHTTRHATEVTADDRWNGMGLNRTRPAYLHRQAMLRDLKLPDNRFPLISRAFLRAGRLVTCLHTCLTRCQHQAKVLCRPFVPMCIGRRP